VALRVLIKGAGEQASGTAHRLFRCGFHVVMTDLPRPTAVRRRVAFASALYQGAVLIEGVEGRAWSLDGLVGLRGFGWQHVPVFADPLGVLRERFEPQVIIDARILKRSEGNAPDHAALVIGYGPGIHAGRHVHAVVETNRGHDLGRVITRGMAADDTGVPGTIAGHSVGRVLRAPCDGTLEVLRDIGSRVEAGDELARVAGSSIHANIAGMVRGMAHPGLEVQRGQKLGDVDPRGDAHACTTISDKARTISGATLELIITHFGLSPAVP
jgi:xanthine dehydrogenase accessory factor